MVTTLKIADKEARVRGVRDITRWSRELSSLVESHNLGKIDDVTLITQAGHIGYRIKTWHTLMSEKELDEG